MSELGFIRLKDYRIDMIESYKFWFPSRSLGVAEGPGEEKGI